ncbi:hypothetical protein Trichorick_01229 [Candidatus Trichorickettsia mobilis]|uniref:Uncharacterized protein n=1 Tax=Candidatus Trichorickettsia mobilis TaxID=1346319 RepID=A0ABZ0UZ11_9RICK|nr:hypothetical protein Trichorick_01229 [Candidatus Trichorickettsia mobilis]
MDVGSVIVSPCVLLSYNWIAPIINGLAMTGITQALR